MLRALLACLPIVPLLIHAPSAQAEVRRTLANGLQVIVEVRKGTSETGVAVAEPGLSGCARIVEVGGRANASTGFDTTVYVHSLPNTEVARALWVESERMGFMMEALAVDNLAVEQRIVGRELDMRGGNQWRPWFCFHSALSRGTSLAPGLQ